MIFGQKWGRRRTDSSRTEARNRTSPFLQTSYICNTQLNTQRDHNKADQPPPSLFLRYSQSQRRHAQSPPALSVRVPSPPYPSPPSSPNDSPTKLNKMPQKCSRSQPHGAPPRPVRAQRSRAVRRSALPHACQPARPTTNAAADRARG